jgi:glucosamine-6-phosphate deaminase
MIPPKTFPSPDALGDALATRLLEGVKRAADARKQYLLGFPTGRTPRPILAALARQLAKKPQDLTWLTFVMLDEYLVPRGDKLEWAPPDADWACHYFGQHEIMRPLNASLPREMQLREKSIWFPEPDKPEAYDKRIEDAGGVDFFLLASGASDGHVAFNQPGSPRDSRTRVVPLSDQTRRDNLKTHPSFGSLEKMPKHGVTVGIATIAAAKSAALVLIGAGKQLTLKNILAAKRYDPKWPATIIHECPNGEIIVDAEAAAVVK